MANLYGSHWKIHSKIWTITLTLYQKSLPNFNFPESLIQDEKKRSMKVFGKISA
jgi:hypothetical protein